jgi:hypothetical protein
VRGETSPRGGRARRGRARRGTRVEETYWLKERGFYAFATTLPPESPPKAEPGRTASGGSAARRAGARAPDRRGHGDARGAALLAELADEPRAVAARPPRSAAIATDWGRALLSDASRLYDPLSYHYGSVWPLFTGWAAMAGYRYGRPSVGYQALMANALLRSRSAVGYVTELLSGDFNAPFGRSSDHQVWSEAMVATPLLRGLFGIEAGAGGRSCASRRRCPRTGTRGRAQRGGRRGPLRPVVSALRGRATIEVTRRGDGPDAAARRRSRLSPRRARALGSRGRARRCASTYVGWATSSACRWSWTRRPAARSSSSPTTRARKPTCAPSRPSRGAQRGASYPAQSRGGRGAPPAPGRACGPVVRAARPHATHARARAGVEARRTGPRDWLLQVPFEGTGERLRAARARSSAPLANRS